MTDPTQYEPEPGRHSPEYFPVPGWRSELAAAVTRSAGSVPAAAERAVDMRYESAARAAVRDDPRWKPAELGYQPLPGDYGLCAGSGAAGALIRHATASPYGHVVLYLGQGVCVQGTSPRANVVPIGAHRDAVWSSWENPASEQRSAIVAAGVQLEGTPYDWAAYVGFALEVLHIRTAGQLDPLYAHDPWRVCSALIVTGWKAGGIDLAAGMPYPNLVSPADLATRRDQIERGQIKV